jgi:AcrR family transcriptional regulator
MTPARGGRPRSDRARIAVLHAVDDLLVEVGYAAMTMKGIAERAGVGRQTVYRWWSTKAEILFEATITDAAGELAPGPHETTAEDLTAYLEAVARFLTVSPAGAAYRALLGEAQHDPAVATLLAATDLLGDSARPVIERAIHRGDLPAETDLDQAVAQLVGPLFFRIVSGYRDQSLSPRSLANDFLRRATRAGTLTAAVEVHTRPATPSARSLDRSPASGSTSQEPPSPTRSPL